MHCIAGTAKVCKAPSTGVVKWSYLCFRRWYLPPSMSIARQRRLVSAQGMPVLPDEEYIAVCTLISTIDSLQYASYAMQMLQCCMAHFLFSINGNVEEGYHMGTLLAFADPVGWLQAAARLCDNGVVWRGLREARSQACTSTISWWQPL